jgi:hypothetical protein
MAGVLLERGNLQQGELRKLKRLSGNNCYIFG